ncbi:MAG: acylphosphatase [Bryobacteraceae bacterium]
MPNYSAKRFLISGRVQGVGFRAFTQQAALEIGVTGWVRNLANGRVEAHANGTPVQLDAFEGRVRTGPRRSQVHSVEVADVAVAEAVTFTIR